MKVEKNSKNNSSTSKILFLVFFIIVVVFMTARYATDEEFRSLIDINVLKKEVSESTLNKIEIDSIVSEGYCFQIEMKFRNILAGLKL